MSNYLTKIIEPMPGVQRDGTEYSSPAYIDGQHCRFYINKPMKMGGYTLIYPGNETIIRTVFPVSRDNSVTDVYMGRYNRLSYVPLTELSLAGVEVDRTPVGFPSIPETVWQMDLITIGTELPLSTFIIAAAIPNGNDIASTATGYIYSGDITSTAPLEPFPALVGPPSGGIVVVSPYLFWFGNDGAVYRSAPGDPTTLDTTTVISNTKIVYGAVTGAGGTVPSVLFWSLTSLVRGVLDAGEGEFSYSTLDTQISIMSARSIVQYDQIFYWIGVDQFYLYNGVVKTLPNTMSRKYFFDNLNFNAREKVWGYVNRQYKEIWWFYPRGTATECNAAIIYNIELNTWYDTSLGRSAGAGAQQYRYPLLADSSTELDEARIGRYGLWQHETGTDKVLYGRNDAIPSWFETNLVNLADENPQNNVQFRTRRVECDFVQSGMISVQVSDRAFPSSVPTVTTRFDFEPNTGKVDLNFMGSYVSYRFESNAAGGFYHLGRLKVDFLPGDGRPGP